MAESPIERRRFLYLSSIAGTTLLAGCSGGGDGGDGSDGGDGGSDGEDGGGGGSDGEGGDGGSVPSEVSDYLDGAMNYEGEVTDAAGEDNPTVEVGAGNGLAFGPAAIRVSTGTTVTWEWTGQGGGHNVVADDGTFDSGDTATEEGTTFEYTFQEAGNFLYYCDPHEASGMKGAVIVE